MLESTALLVDNGDNLPQLSLCTTIIRLRLNAQRLVDAEIICSGGAYDLLHCKKRGANIVSHQRLHHPLMQNR